MVSTQDFAHQVWLSLENIRERLAVVETEVRHSRQDLLRLESFLISHIANHCHIPEKSSFKPDSGNGNGAAINIRISRKMLSSGGVICGGIVAVVVGMGKAMGWW